MPPEATAHRLRESIDDPDASVGRFVWSDEGRPVNGEAFAAIAAQGDAPRMGTAQARRIGADDDMGALVVEAEDPVATQRGVARNASADADGAHDVVVGGRQHVVVSTCAHEVSVPDSGGQHARGRADSHQFGSGRHLHAESGECPAPGHSRIVHRNRAPRDVIPRALGGIPPQGFPGRDVRNSCCFPSGGEIERRVGSFRLKQEELRTGRQEESGNTPGGAALHSSAVVRAPGSVRIRTGGDSPRTREG